MCFYYSLPEKAKKIAKRFSKQYTLFTDSDFEEKVLIKGFDHAPTNLIVTQDSIQPAKWGLIPFWSNSDFAEKVQKENRNVNAKEETVFTLPSFRTPIRKHRCLVPATGWFEYHYEQGKVQAIYYIYVKGLEIFSFAGIYDSWKGEGEKEVQSYAILTTRANELMSFIHNGGNNPYRMPVILSAEAEEIWLDPATPQEELKALMQPFPTERMEAYPLKTDPKEFQRLSPFDPHLLEGR